MTEKEYKKLISEIDITSEVKSTLSKAYEEISTLIMQLDQPFLIKEIKKSGLLQSQMAINSTNYFNILINSSLELSINPNYHKTLIINEIIKNILLNYEIKSYEINLNVIKLKKDDLSICLQVLDNEEYEEENRKLKFIEEVNQKYTLFKNTYRLIRHLVNEVNLELLDDYTLLIIFVCGLEKYYSGNKYDNYMIAFTNALDDLINTKKLELQENYQSVIPKMTTITKGYIVTNPFNGNNLTNNINDANVSEIRKFKKKVAKLYEQVNVDNGSSSILTLNINPQINSNGTISWSYNVLGRNIENHGGEFQNTEIESKNASLKAFFRGLKAIVTSNIYNKNITVVTKHKDLLKCVEKDPSEAENNSRRKTITKYIEDNKLLVSYQIKE